MRKMDLILMRETEKTRKMRGKKYRAKIVATTGVQTVVAKIQIANFEALVKKILSVA